MIKILFGNWPRRIVTVLVCMVTFLISITGALTVGLKDSPEYADQVKRLPLLGTLAVQMSGVSEKAPAEGALALGTDVKTYRDVRPLSAEEISNLIMHLKSQREVYKQQVLEVGREQKRIGTYRAELTKERDEIDKLRNSIYAEWEAIKKAKEEMEKETAILKSEEAVNLKKLAAQYKAMKVDKAAEIMEQLEQSTAAKILYLMPERNAGKILEQLSKGVAPQLIEKMRLLKQVK